MAVKVKNKKIQKKQRKDIFETIFEGKYRHVIFIAVLFIILSSFFFKIAFKNYVPQASDTMQWRSSAEQLIEYNKTNKDQALWNPAIFSGMPSYLTSFASKYPFINTIQKLTNKVINWRVLLLFTMGLGVYFLMIYLKFDPIIAFISAIAFSLSVHFIGLIEIGHNSKFKAVVYIPWIFFFVHYLKDRKTVLALGLATLMIIGQLRENHPQISYYTFLMLAIYWIFQLVWAIREKKIKPFITFTLLLLAAGIIALMAVAQPYMSTMEYGQYTIRGGSSGLETSYATSWSFHPMEILSFINPSIYGGVSPYYWGWMPFTQTSMYMGVIIFFLGLLALFSNRSKLVKILGTVSVVVLFISFGRHLPFLSNFLLNYLPGFNKFRVPAMILVILQFAFVVLAGYGLKTIIDRRKENKKKFFKNLQTVLYVVIGLLIVFFLIINSMQNSGFVRDGEQSKYSLQQIQQLRTLRYEKALNDGLVTGIFLIAAILLTILYGNKKMSKYPFLIIIMILVVVDLLLVDSRFLQNVVPQNYIDKTYVKTEADKFLEKDNETFRIYPLGGGFGQNQWGYYNQTIGGYHGAKLKRYQEILDNCLNYEFQNRIPINWNIVNMLNVKYVIFQENLPLENLEYAFYDRRQKQTIFKNKNYLPRAWFVKNIERIDKKENIWKRLNQQEFNPAESAIIEQEIPPVSVPAQSSVELESFDLHYLKFNVKTDSTAFLTVSEIYYPAGWKAYIDGEETEIYPTNYILRGVVIPAGEHVLEMKFAPQTYTISIKLSLAGLIITIILLIIGLFFYYKENYKGEIVYTMKKTD
ncbi:MAG: YfhO family protein [Candidatus Cloacimonetes bacterium]|nr:YfhO family protein [Candidatus Cloacimonadota bacterium]MCF7814052.1 YfhO family protein [Candidatus Cloacimonadota bacterium]MCF7868646.1 YfhO family protein [Candidatus Cloacimonadota bacterium]MCF7884101.1 YfhO family protein [Candidatus Cloacimonadota bacterium]